MAGSLFADAHVFRTGENTARVVFVSGVERASLDRLHVWSMDVDTTGESVTVRTWSEIIARKLLAYYDQHARGFADHYGRVFHHDAPMVSPRGWLSVGTSVK